MKGQRGKRKAKNIRRRNGLGKGEKGGNYERGEVERSFWGLEGMSSVLSVPGLWHSSQGLSSWEPWEPGWPLLLQRAAAAGLLGFVGIEAALGRVGCVGWLGMGGNGGSARQSRAQQSPEQLWEGRAGLNWTNPGLKPQS